MQLFSYKCCKLIVSHQYVPCTVNCYCNKFNIHNPSVDISCAFLLLGRTKIKLSSKKKKEYLIYSINKALLTKSRGFPLVFELHPTAKSSFILFPQQKHITFV